MRVIFDVEETAVADLQDHLTMQGFASTVQQMGAAMQHCVVVEWPTTNILNLEPLVAWLQGYYIKAGYDTLPHVCVATSCEQRCSPIEVRR
jgi:hypothetical protein